MEEEEENEASERRICIINVARLGDLLTAVTGPSLSNMSALNVAW